MLPLRHPFGLRRCLCDTSAARRCTAPGRVGGHPLDACTRPPHVQVIKSDRAVAPLNGHFLVDPEELKRKQEEVANQSKLRYGVDGEKA